LRTAYRGSHNPNNSNNRDGFRCVGSAPPGPWSSEIL